MNQLETTPSSKRIFPGTLTNQASKFLSATMTLLLWLITAPILLFMVGITLCYATGTVMMGPYVLTNGPTSTLSCAAAAIFAILIVNIDRVVDWFSRRKKTNQTDECDFLPAEQAVRRASKIAVGSSALQKFLVAAALPGFLFIVQACIGSLVFSYYDYSPLKEAMNLFARATLYILPATITWRVCVLMSCHRFCSRETAFFVRNLSGWESGRIGDIISVDVQRASTIAEKTYDEDDDSQHLISIRLSNRRIVRLELNHYNAKNRDNILKWFRKKISKDVLTNEAQRFLYKERLLEPKEKRELASNQNAEATPEAGSFTALWQSELNSHMARTNYATLEPGQKLQNGRFTVTAYLSSGGFSTTYLCTTLQGDSVVVKESALPANLDEETKKQISGMFAREARMLQRCTHTRIASVLDSFHENEREYLVLEFIDGAPLSNLVRTSGPLLEHQALSWLRQMAEFLQHLHSLEPPIVHRDFTPENLLVHKSGDLYLIDFGAANDFIGQATGTLIGKQSYISPEQLQGKACQQSDIYAFGATAFFLLTGADPLPLTELSPTGCSEALKALVRDCTRFDKDERIKSAAEVIERLNAIESSKSKKDKTA